MTIHEIGIELNSKDLLIDDNVKKINCYFNKFFDSQYLNLETKIFDIPNLLSTNNIDSKDYFNSLYNQSIDLEYMIKKQINSIENKIESLKSTDGVGEHFFFKAMENTKIGYNQTVKDMLIYYSIDKKEFRFNDIIFYSIKQGVNLQKYYTWLKLIENDNEFINKHKNETKHQLSHIYFKEQNNQFTQPEQEQTKPLEKIQLDLNPTQMAYFVHNLISNEILNTTKNPNYWKLFQTYFKDIHGEDFKNLSQSLNQLVTNNKTGKPKHKANEIENAAKKPNA